MDAVTLKNAFSRHVSSFITGEVFHRGTIVGVLKTCAGNDGNYRLVLKALTGKTSSKELSDAQWFALYKFVLPIKPEGERWRSGHTNEELTRFSPAQASIDIRRSSWKVKQAPVVRT